MLDRIPVYIAPNIGWAINLFISYPEMPLILSKDNAKFWLSERRENLFSIQGLEKRRRAEKSEMCAHLGSLGRADLIMSYYNKSAQDSELLLP